jgi:hypothetical protein
MKGVTINSVYPWGRSAHEYERMFALDGPIGERPILDCGGGPSSFTAEMTARGWRVVACDPLYQFAPDEIERRITECYAMLVEGMRIHHDRFVWDDLHRSPEHVGEIRMAAMRRFIQDYPEGSRRGRYVTACLPDLPFADRTFELALVSHLLFLYSAEMTEEFHVRALRELLRVADEVRAYPLLDMDGVPSTHVDPVRAQLASEGFFTELRPVPYEFQVGARTMLVAGHRQS